MTSGNAPAAGCSRCRERCTATLIFACGPADERSQRPFPQSTFPQVKVGLSSQGRGRTADLPPFRGSITPESSSSKSFKSPAHPHYRWSTTVIAITATVPPSRIVPFSLWASYGEPRPTADLWGNCGPRGSTRPGAGRSRIRLPDG
jgi:hypothetical protein